MKKSVGLEGQYLRDCVGGYLVTGRIQILNLAVIRPLVRHVESRGNGTAIRIFSSVLEQVGVQALVQIVERVIEGQHHYLWYLLRQIITCYVFFFFLSIGSQSKVVFRAFCAVAFIGGKEKEKKKHTKVSNSANCYVSIIEEKYREREYRHLNIKYI